LDIPEGYEGREQSYLKHEVLREYLTPWGFKLAAAGRGRPSTTRLWYVDTFAGPWGTDSESLDGTSVSIGLEVLETAQAGWRDKGGHIDVGAVFVERKRKSFDRLQQLLGGYYGPVDCHAFHGRFGDRTLDIKKVIGSDPAFLFVDPTGWRGAEMQHVRELVSLPRRDVLINVMYNFINRFKADGRPYIRDSLKDFFGLGDEDLPADLDEEGLMGLYRSNLKDRCQVRYSADLFIQHPTVDRTWFRLVIGGNDPAVIRLFRDVERKVVGKQAHEVRAEAKRRDREIRTGQSELQFGVSGVDDRYGKMNAAAKITAEARVIGFLRDRGQTKYEVLWPALLEELHITLSDLNTVVGELRRRGLIDIAGWKPRQRVPTETSHLRLAEPT
jgi:three-Cys-motif partner protein